MPLQGMHINPKSGPCHWVSHRALRVCKFDALMPDHLRDSQKAAPAAKKTLKMSDQSQIPYNPKRDNLLWDIKKRWVYVKYIHLAVPWSGKGSLPRGRFGSGNPTPTIP